MKRFIVYSPPALRESEVRASARAWRSGWITTGPMARAFEEEVARYVGAKHAVALSSCSAALDLVLHALGIGPGDEVLVPVLTFAATAHAVRHVGAMPIFCDVLPGTLCLDPDDAARRVTRRTKAILPVHYAGVPCEMREILALARRKRLFVVEDAAHALGTVYGGQRIGGLPTAATCFSFYATKNVTTAEGGMVVTNNGRLAERVRRLASQGILRAAEVFERRYAPRGSWDYEIVELGWKANMPDVLAAVGIGQMRRIDRILADRARRASIYHRAIRGTDAKTIRPSPRGRSAHHLYPLLLPPWIDRDGFIRRLGERGIGTSVHFKPLHLHTYYRELLGHMPGDFPIAEDAFSRLVCLPISPATPMHDVRRAAREVRRLLLA